MMTGKYTHLDDQKVSGSVPVSNSPSGLLFVDLYPPLEAESPREFWIFVDMLLISKESDLVPFDYAEYNCCRLFQIKGKSP